MAFVHSLPIGGDCGCGDSGCSVCCGSLSGADIFGDGVKGSSCGCSCRSAFDMPHNHASF